MARAKPRSAVMMKGEDERKKDGNVDNEDGREEEEEGGKDSTSKSAHKPLFKRLRTSTEGAVLVTGSEHPSSSIKPDGDDGTEFKFKMCPVRVSCRRPRNRGVCRYSIVFCSLTRFSHISQGCLKRYRGNSGLHYHLNTAHPFRGKRRSAKSV